jgi:hypothetical protein
VVSAGAFPPGCLTVLVGQVEAHFADVTSVALFGSFCEQLRQGGIAGPGALLSPTTGRSLEGPRRPHQRRGRERSGVGSAQARPVDVVLSCVDNYEARLAVNQVCPLSSPDYPPCLGIARHTILSNDRHPASHWKPLGGTGIN